MKRKNIIGPIIRRRRIEAELTIEEVHTRIVAEGGSLTSQQIHQIEARERKVRDYEIAQLAVALGVELGALFPKRRS